VIDVQMMMCKERYWGAKEQKKITIWDEVVGWAIDKWAVYRCNDR
jgi:hypothetical protein